MCSQICWSRIVLVFATLLFSEFECACLCFGGFSDSQSSPWAKHMSHWSVSLPKPKRLAQLQSGQGWATTVTLQWTVLPSESMPLSLTHKAVHHSRWFRNTQTWNVEPISFRSSIWLSWARNVQLEKYQRCQGFQWRRVAIPSCLGALWIGRRKSTSLQNELYCGSSEHHYSESCCWRHCSHHWPQSFEVAWWLNCAHKSLGKIFVD